MFSLFFKIVGRPRSGELFFTLPCLAVIISTKTEVVVGKQSCLTEVF